MSVECSVDFGRLMVVCQVGSGIGGIWTEALQDHVLVVTCVVVCGALLMC